MLVRYHTSNCHQTPPSVYLEFSRPIVTTKRVQHFYVRPWSKIRPAQETNLGTEDNTQTTLSQSLFPCSSVKENKL